MKTGWWKIAVIALLGIAIIGVMQMKASQTKGRIGQDATHAASAADAAPVTNLKPIVENVVVAPSTDDATVKTPAAASNTKAKPLGPKPPMSDSAEKEPAKAADAAVLPTLPEPVPVRAAPVKKATFIELGADKCIPCKMMQPIMDELRREYPETLEVVFYDVWKNPEFAEKYDVSGIPTQVLLDGDGKEIFRHVGFWPKDEIVARFKELGIEL